MKRAGRWLFNFGRMQRCRWCLDPFYCPPHWRRSGSITRPRVFRGLRMANRISRRRCYEQQMASPICRASGARRGTARICGILLWTSSPALQMREPDPCTQSSPLSIHQITAVLRAPRTSLRNPRLHLMSLLLPHSRTVLRNLSPRKMNSPPPTPLQPRSRTTMRGLDPQQMSLQTPRSTPRTRLSSRKMNPRKMNPRKMS